MVRLLSDINETLAKELGLEPDDDTDGSAEEAPEAPTPKSRLWVPGQP